MKNKEVRLDSVRIQLHVLSHELKLRYLKRNWDC